MSSLIGVMLALLAGAALGIMYFCGLLWTIQRSLVSSQPGLWFFASFLLRTSLAVGGFYLLSHYGWQALAASLTGFVVTRILMTRYLPSSSWRIAQCRGGSAS